MIRYGSIQEIHLQKNSGIRVWVMIRYCGQGCKQMKVLKKKNICRKYICQEIYLQEIYLPGNISARKYICQKKLWQSSVGDNKIQWAGLQSASCRWSCWSAHHPSYILPHNFYLICIYFIIYTTSYIYYFICIYFITYTTSYTSYTSYTSQEVSGSSGARFLARLFCHQQTSHSSFCFQNIDIRIFL